MERLQKKLDELDLESPNLNDVMYLRKHILSRYPDLERAFNLNNPTNQTYQNLHTYVRTINSNMRDLASNAFENEPIELHHNMLAIYLGRTEELTAQLAKDPLEENQSYAAVAKAVISRKPRH